MVTKSKQDKEKEKSTVKKVGVKSKKKISEAPKKPKVKESNPIMVKKSYCGTDNVLPKGYTEFGTNYDCLRKGVGAGIAVTEDKIQKTGQIRIKQVKPKKKKKYCGKKQTLPQNYDKKGNRYDCLKKGFGIGIMVTNQKYLE